jgi:hypothetical protein
MLKTHITAHAENTVGLDHARPLPDRRLPTCRTARCAGGKDEPAAR